MPSSTAALGFSQDEHNFLGGWAAKQSDRYARVSRYKLSKPPKKAVVNATQDRDAKEPLDERETFTEFETYLVKKNLSPEAQRARRMDFSSVPRAPESLENARECHHEEQLELTPVEDDGPAE